MSRKRSAGDPPILSDTTIEALIGIEKPVERDEWQRLRNTTKTRFVGRDHIPLPDVLHKQPTRGTLHLYVRVGNVEADFSTGLVFTDIDETTSYPLIRCNGPSHPHRNQIERDKILYRPHIHRLTERYQRTRFKNDGYAEESNEFTNLPTALDHLAELVNVTPVGTLFL